MSSAARIFTLLSLCCACNRTESAPGPGSAQPAPLEPPNGAVPSATAAADTTSVPAASASSIPAASAVPSASTAEPAKPPCRVPLSEVAPPRAKPASAAECPKEPGPLPHFDRGALYFVDPAAPSAKPAKALHLTLEIARTPDAHEHGLMYRTKMPEDHGMLFEWNNEVQRVFWMHNTCLPLDMLFIARDGTVAGILEQVPVLNDEPRQVPCLASYVLEVNAGWCRRHGVKPGMRMMLE